MIGYPSLVPQGKASFRQLGREVSERIDKDYIQVRRQVGGTFQNIYENCPCHIVLQKGDNPQPTAVSVNPVIIGIAVLLEPSFGLRNGDRVFTKIMNRETGEMLSWYSGEIGQPFVSESRQMAQLQVWALGQLQELPPEFIMPPGQDGGGSEPGGPEPPECDFYFVGVFNGSFRTMQGEQRNGMFSIPVSYVISHEVAGDTLTLKTRNFAVIAPWAAGLWLQVEPRTTTDFTGTSTRIMITKPYGYYWRISRMDVDWDTSEITYTAQRIEPTAAMLGAYERTDAPRER
jgi:hypothetical protein